MFGKGSAHLTSGPVRIATLTWLARVFRSCFRAVQAIAWPGPHPGSIAPRRKTSLLTVPRLVEAAVIGRVHKKWGEVSIAIAPERCSKLNCARATVGANFESRYLSMDLAIKKEN